MQLALRKRSEKPRRNHAHDGTTSTLATPHDAHLEDTRDVTTHL